uniref:F-ATPase protein 6 n=1 Tax=Oryza meridionalis TaxID=40149 RepID=A0A0E0DCF1_9ORYZ
MGLNQRYSLWKLLNDSLKRRRTVPQAEIDAFFEPFERAQLLALTGLELGVAILQAHVSTISICIYLNDAINLHQNE